MLLRDLAAAVDPAVRSYIDQLFSQSHDGWSVRRKRGRRAGRRVQRQITTVSRGRRVITSRDNNNNISPSAGSSLINIPLCGNIDDNELSSTATSRGLAIGTLNVRSVGKKSAVCDLLNTHSLDILALQETWHENTDSISLLRAAPPGYAATEEVRHSATSKRLSNRMQTMEKSQSSAAGKNVRISMLPSARRYQQGRCCNVNLLAGFSGGDANFFRGAHDVP